MIFQFDIMIVAISDARARARVRLRRQCLDRVGVIARLGLGNRRMGQLAMADVQTVEQMRIR